MLECRGILPVIVATVLPRRIAQSRNPEIQNLEPAIRSYHQVLGLDVARMIPLECAATSNVSN